MKQILGRRELNKTRTRESITAALRHLAEQSPLDEVTVEQLAEAAGVSRRTFFNYFGSIPTVISEVFTSHAAVMVEALDLELLRQDPIEAVRALVSHDAIPADFLGWLAALNCHQSTSETSVLVDRAVWADLAAWLEGQLEVMLPARTDPLYVATLAAGVMGTFAAAEQAWLAELGGRTVLRPADLRSFTGHLDHALSYLAQGWRIPT